MGYITNEISKLLGYPIELYTFDLNAEQWLYTSGDRTFIISAGYTTTYYTTYTTKYYTPPPAQIFIPAAIKRSAIELNREINRNILSLDVPFDLAPAQLWLGGAPEGLMNLTIYRSHRSDSTKEIAQIWRGRVISVMFKGHDVTMSCEPIFTSLKRGGIRSVYGLPCRHVLFSTQCGADPALFRLTGTVAAINGTAIDVAGLNAQPDGYWVNGKVNAGLSRNLIRAIVGHTGNTIVLDRVISNLAIGDPIDVLPGCAHNVDDCTNKFSNLPNYGGFPFIPRKDPFSGDAITN